MTPTKRRIMKVNHFVTIPDYLIRMLKARPEEMVATPTCLAVWHSGLEMAIIIPGDFWNISDLAAEMEMNKHLKKLDTQLIS